jgi:hypothetical protein
MYRRGFRLALLLLTALVIAAPALARRSVFVDQGGRPLRGQLHTWLLHSKAPLPPGRIVIRRVPCPHNPILAGCVYTLRPRTVYLLPGLRIQARRIFYHELGHVFDLTVLNGRERARFKRIIGIHRSGWLRGALPPSEWFGDGYSLCSMHARLGRRPAPTPYGYAPSPRAHARVCRLIRSAAKPHGRRPTRPKNPPPVIDVPPPPPGQTGSGGCTLVDQLLTDCSPAAPPPPPPPGLPIPSG